MGKRKIGRETGVVQRERERDKKMRIETGAGERMRNRDGREKEER